MRFHIAAAVVSLLVLSSSGPAGAADDHLKCYQIKDPLNLAAVVDLDSPQFGGLQAGCKVGKAKYFCAPAEKTVIFAEDKKTHSPISPLPVGGPDAGDRICYKVKCPTGLVIPEQPLTDQFGVRPVGKYKVSYLCTPAVTTSYQRFVDNGDGTVSDHNTGLQWEKKVVGSGCLHCVDDTYTWSSSGSAPDGTAFTSLLAQLNGGTSSDGTSVANCFAGRCDWRLPSSSELQSILLTSFPCGTSPCIHPTFGPTKPQSHWSATTYASSAASVWYVDFGNGAVAVNLKTLATAVRGVRGP
jgi:hypothetical protein